jgi:Putative viral replication protein.
MYKRATVLLSTAAEWPTIRFLSMGHEICPETRRRHLQGYLQLYTKKRLETLKKMLCTKLDCKSIYLDRQRGTVEEAINYTEKDGNHVRWGRTIH